MFFQIFMKRGVGGSLVVSTMAGCVRIDINMDTPTSPIVQKGTKYAILQFPKPAFAVSIWQVSMYVCLMVL